MSAVTTSTSPPRSILLLSSSFCELVGYMGALIVSGLKGHIPHLEKPAIRFCAWLAFTKLLRRALKLVLGNYRPSLFSHESMTGFRPVYFKWVEEHDIQWLGNMHAVWGKAKYDDTMFSCCFDSIRFVVRGMAIHKKHI